MPEAVETAAVVGAGLAASEVTGLTNFTPIGQGGSGKNKKPPLPNMPPGLGVPPGLMAALSQRPRFPPGLLKAFGSMGRNPLNIDLGGSGFSGGFPTPWQGMGGTPWGSGGESPGGSSGPQGGGPHAPTGATVANPLVFGMEAARGSGQAAGDLLGRGGLLGTGAAGWNMLLTGETTDPRTGNRVSSPDIGGGSGPMTFGPVSVHSFNPARVMQPNKEFGIGLWENTGQKKSGGNSFSIIGGAKGQPAKKGGQSTTSKPTARPSSEPFRSDKSIMDNKDTSTKNRKKRRREKVGQLKRQLH